MKIFKRLFKCCSKKKVKRRKDMILSYMPWYLMENEITLGDFIISPFHMSKTNLPFFSGVENEVKAILINHLERPFTSNDRQEFPIKHASIIRKVGEEFGYEFTGPEQDEVVILQYVLAFAGISNREFLHQALYLCSENFKVFFQKFVIPMNMPFTPAISTKRKDGFTSAGFSSGLFREVKPWHVATQQLAPNRNYRLHFDSDLAKCLWSIYKNPIHQNIWEENIYPSVFSYYIGNTDGNTYQIDIVYSASAFEKLIAGNQFYLHQFLRALRGLIASSGLIIRFPGNTNRNWQSITYKKSNGNFGAAPNILEAWLIEFKSLRNNFAHGHAVNRAALIWTIDEHLKISSFLFPLFLKLFISVNNLCPCDGSFLSDKDVKQLEASGELLEIDDLFEPWDGINDTEWDRIIKDTHW
jgi:hypothetical protein